MAVFAQQLRIAASPEFMALFRAKSKLHPELLWRLCDIQSYGPTLVPIPGRGTWMPDSLGWDPENSWAAEEVEQLPAAVEHAATVPARAPRRGTFV